MQRKLVNYKEKMKRMKTQDEKNQIILTDKRKSSYMDWMSESQPVLEQESLEG